MAEVRHQINPFPLLAAGSKALLLRLAAGGVFLLLCCSLLQADTKRVSVTSRLVELAVQSPPDVTVDWEARDPLTLEWKSYKTIDGKSVVVFWMQGDQAVLISDLIDWEHRKREKTTWIVTVGDVPPDPSPPTPPGPQPEVFGLETISRESRVLIRPEGQQFLPAVAANFESTASAVAAGGLRTIQSAREAIQTSNRATLGTAGVAAWNPWLVKVGTAVDALEDTGRFSDVKLYGKALAEIARGLR